MVIKNTLLATIVPNASEICTTPEEYVHKNPLVSVGILTYNRPKGLRKTLECITGQTYKNLEIIVSNNCSPESDTDDVVREFMVIDPRIQYYRQAENKGQTFNFKFVFERSIGEYFMWAADDDEWEPLFVDTLLLRLEKYSEISVAMSGVKRIDESGNLYDIIRFPELTDIKYNQFKFLLFAVCHREITLYMYGLFRSNSLKKFYQNLDNSFASDFVVICEMLFTLRFHYVDCILHNNRYYLNSGNTAVRYPDEEIGKNYGDRFNYPKLFFRFVFYLCRSKNIPLNRKLWIPFLVIRHGIWVSENIAYMLFIIAKKNPVLCPLAVRLRNFVRGRGST